MKKQTELSYAIQGIIIFTAILLIASIWPLDMWKDRVVSQTEESGSTMTEPLQPEGALMQEFVPQYDYVENIAVLVDSLGKVYGRFHFTLYDESLTVLWEADRLFARRDEKAFFQFPIKMELEAGKPYYYVLKYSDRAFGVYYQEKTGGEAEENGSLYYNLEEMPDCQAVARYEYRIPSQSGELLAAAAVILLAAVLLCAVIYAVFRYFKIHRRVSVNTPVRIVGWSVDAMAVLYFLGMIVGKKALSSDAVDNMVYSAGVLLGGAVLFYAFLRFEAEKLTISWKDFTDKIPEYLRAVFLGLAVLACCSFVNAGSNYAQGLALREMCIFLGLAIITMWGRKEVWNIGSIVYAAAAAAVGIWYSSQFSGQGEVWETAWRTAWMAAVWGILILNTVYTLMVTIIRKKSYRFSLLPVLLMGIFFVCLLVFRNGNSWELAVVIPFGILYLRRLPPAKMESFLKSAANAVLLSFVVMTYRALMYRPFHYYIYIRYPGMFNTPTVTTLYLGLVMAAALCMVISAYTRTGKLKDAWKELLLLGIAGVYQCLTLSRTGILTFAGVLLTADAVYLLLHHSRRDILIILRKFIYVLLAIAFCFPIVFTATRAIPAIVNAPFYFEGEAFLDIIQAGEPVDSNKYITVSRFFGLSSERILGKVELSEEEIISANQIIEQQKGEGGGDQSGTLDIDDMKVTVGVNKDGELVGKNTDYTNGRAETFRKYLKCLNLKGHAAVGLPEEDGGPIIHAHNSFIQMAYDCGIITGIIFIVLYLLLGLRTVKYYKFRSKHDTYAMLPMIIFAAFGISSIVEYVFRPTIPLGFIYLLMMKPLLHNFESYGKKKRSGSTGNSVPPDSLKGMEKGKKHGKSI